MKAREFKRLEQIERALAKARQGKRTDLDKGNIPANFPECNGHPSPQGDSRDIAAAAVGWSGRKLS